MITEIRGLCGQRRHLTRFAGECYSVPLLLNENKLFVFHNFKDHHMSLKN